MKTYTTDYGDYILTYSIEGDVDGIHATIEKVEGVTDFELVFDKDDIKDMKFICEFDYSDKAFQHYKKTGQDF